MNRLVSEIMRSEIGRARRCRVALATCLAMTVSSLFATGCGSKASTQADDRAGAAPAAKHSSNGSALPPPVRYSLSPEAAEIAHLLDRKAYRAAKRLFDARIHPATTDAGLYAVYVRYLLETQNPACPDFITNPIWRDDTYLWLGICDQAITLAIEFDPTAADYVADVVLRTLHARGRELAASGGGFGFIHLGDIPINLRIRTDIHPNDWHRLSMANFGWRGIEASATVGRAWADAFERLATDFAKDGRVASAMYLANLSGDLAQGSGTVGDEDFRRATTVFTRALKNRERDSENKAVEQTVVMFKRLFAKELADRREGRVAYPELEPLIAELKRLGMHVDDHLDPEP